MIFVKLVCASVNQADKKAHTAYKNSCATSVMFKVICEVLIASKYLVVPAT